MVAPDHLVMQINGFDGKCFTFLLAQTNVVGLGI